MIQTTIQAFRQMMATTNIHEELEIDKGEVLEMQKKINEHALDNPTKWGITEELMHKWLEKVGYEKISKTLWEDSEISNT